MSTRARLQNSNDSKSLWNYTLSPGWSEFDAHILRLAVMRYGCGAWREINKHFPLKTCGQLNLQTQRLFGQQALAEFNKVHIDPSRIKAINDKIDGFRKNTCLINEGNNLRAEEKERRRKGHIAKYGIPKEIYEQIVVPVVLDPPVPCNTVIDDIEKLREMYRAVYDIQLRIKHLQMNNGKNAANIAVKAKQEKIKNNNKNKKENEQKDSMEVDVEIIATKQNEKEPEPEAVSGPVVAAPAAPTPAPANDNDGDMAMDMDGMDGMDEETAMALALSASMASTNINTPAIEKKTKSKKNNKSTKKSGKKSTKKKKTKSAKKKSAKKSSKKSRKRKKMDSDDEYEPNGAQPKKKRSRKK